MMIIKALILGLNDKVCWDHWACHWDVMMLDDLRKWKGEITRPQGCVIRLVDFGQLPRIH
jgi:hypothetical protein